MEVNCVECVVNDADPRLLVGYHVLCEVGGSPPMERPVDISVRMLFPEQPTSQMMSQRRPQRRARSLPRRNKYIVSSILVDFV